MIDAVCFFFSRRTWRRCCRTPMRRAATRGRAPRRMKKPSTRATSSQERTALLRTRCAIDPSRTARWTWWSEQVSNPTEQRSTAPHYIKHVCTRVCESITADTLPYGRGLETGWPFLQNVDMTLPHNQSHSPYLYRKLLIEIRLLGTVASSCP